MRVTKKKQINSAVSLPAAELRNLQTLRPHQHNARTHSKRQIEQIARSIERFGFLNPVLIDATCTIIAGHGRVEAAKLLGLAQIPTLRLANLTDAENRVYKATTRILKIGDQRLAREISRLWLGTRKLHRRDSTRSH